MATAAQMKRQREDDEAYAENERQNLASQSFKAVTKQPKKVTAERQAEIQEQKKLARAGNRRAQIAEGKRKGDLSARQVLSMARKGDITRAEAREINDS